MSLLVLYPSIIFCFGEGHGPGLFQDVVPVDFDGRGKGCLSVCRRRAPPGTGGESQVCVARPGGPVFTATETSFVVHEASVLGRRLGLERKEEMRGWVGTGKVRSVVSFLHTFLGPSVGSGGCRGLVSWMEVTGGA